MLPRTFVAGWLFVQEGCDNTYVYNASQYAWTGFQVNREVITMLPRTFVAGWLFFPEGRDIYYAYREVVEVMLESFIFGVYPYRRSW